jgi:aryl-alcohol dehydrogenase-like predicted oxidoreductase
VETRLLGRTCLRVSRIGVGLAALGRPAYINVGHGHDLGGHLGVRDMRRNAHSVLDAAYEQGVRYFDAARSYGEAEEFLASWLRTRRIGRDEVTVGSKWGYTYTADWRVEADEHEVKDLSVQTLRRQLAESRALLGEHLDLYQIHSATLESGVLEDGDVLDELEHVRATGVAIGVTVTGPRQAETIERVVELARFDTVQATWNVLERSAGPALEHACASGMGVIVKEGLANGRLTARGDVEDLQAEAARRGTTADALALAACLAQPWADVVLSGAATVEQLNSNVAALEVTDAADELDQLVEQRDAYWTRRAALPWN